MSLCVLPDLASLAAVAELYPIALPSTFGLLRLMLRRNGDAELPDGDVIFKCGAELPDGRTCGKTCASYKNSVCSRQSRNSMMELLIILRSLAVEKETHYP